MLTDRLWMRLRALFVPSVALVALFDLLDTEGAADSIKQLYDWERDRLFTLAKGLGAAAVGVLTTLIVDAVAQDVEASTVVVFLSAGLVALLLAWAGFLLTGLSRLSEQYSIAMRIFT